MSDPLPLEINPTPEPTLNVIPCTTQTSNIYTQPLSSTLKTRHSPSPPPNNLQITIDKHPIPPKKKYNILGDPAFFDSGILPPTFHPLKTPSQTNTMSDEFLRTHLSFKANLSSLYKSPTQNEFCFPQERNFDHYIAYAS